MDRHSSLPLPDRTDLGQFIPLHYHYHMLQDEQRVSAFREAIHAVTPHRGTVVDLGGGTGILSYYAAQCAEKVYCVERNAELADAARYFLGNNPGGERVEVVDADASDYLPPHPVDVVVCEMLHVGLLREKQVQVLQTFKQNYQQRFEGPLPRFVPDASLLGIQLIEQSFDFHGFRAPIPMFQVAGTSSPKTRELSEPVVYDTLWYEKPLPERIRWSGSLPIAQPGRLNALRLATKNILAILPTSEEVIDWSNQYLVVPVDAPVVVKPGDWVSVSLEYETGGTIGNFMQSTQIHLDVSRSAMRRAA